MPALPCNYLDLSATEAIYFQIVAQNTVSGPMWASLGAGELSFSVQCFLGKKEEVSSSGEARFGSGRDYGCRPSQSEPCSAIAFSVPVLLGLNLYILRYLPSNPRERKMLIVLQ